MEVDSYLLSLYYIVPLKYICATGGSVLTVVDVTQAFVKKYLRIAAEHSDVEFAEITGDETMETRVSDIPACLLVTDHTCALKFPCMIQF